MQNQSFWMCKSKKKVDCIRAMESTVLLHHHKSNFTQNLPLPLPLTNTHARTRTHTSSPWDIPEGESTCKIICHAPNMEQLLFGEAGSARYKIAETDKVLAICKGETKRFK